MSEMGFYLLPTGKFLKKNKKSRLKNFPAGYVGSFYRNLADNVDNFIGSDFLIFMEEWLMILTYHQMI